MKGHFRHALRMALLYAVFGAVWIFVSDRLLLTLINDVVTLSLLQTYKGWLYVLATGFLVFYLVLYSERRIRAGEDRFRSLVETSSDWIWEVNRDTVYTYVSPKVESLLGYRAEEVLGRTPFDFMAPEEAVRVREAFTAFAGKRLPFAGLINTNIHRNGGQVVLETSGDPFFDENGRWLGYRGIDRDITERKKMEDDLRQSAQDRARLRKSESQLEYMAHYDLLTDLPNRLLFLSRLENALKWARNYRTLVGVLFIDLDHFKHVNDSLGHAAGDELLVAVARRTSARLRQDDSLARLGGDEFLLLLEPISEIREATVVARDLLSVLAAPFHLTSGQRVYIGASIGISIFPGDGQTPSELLRNAEAAMYHAKNNGRNQLFFYTGNMNTDSLARLEMEAALRQAIPRGELLLYYQPKVDLLRGEMTGCEALVRWRREGEAELITPDKFIPLAEKNGQIIAIGNWVIEEACRQIAAWRDDGLGGIRVAINVSARQFRTGNMAAVVSGALERHRLTPECLELELTESMLMENPEEAVTLLTQLKEIGLTLSLDDFGTGYSSFAYLSRFPIDILKIDCSFVRDIIFEPHAAMIATSIIGLAHRLGLKVVAEGVETESQLSYLRRNGCDEMQGFFFSPPLAAGDFAALNRERGSLALERTPEAARDHTLLLVDDEAAVLPAIRRALDLDGYRILTATSGREALELLARNEVQVVLSDERMPEMNGTELLEKIKVLYPHTVRLVLTGYTDLESVAGAVNKGAIYKFLTKPWEGNHLREQVSEAFAYYEAVIKPKAMAESGVRRQEGLSALS